MVCICIWLQVTQNPYSSQVPAKETSSHMRRQRQTGPDPMQSSGPFLQIRVLRSISSNILFPFGLPGVSTVLTEKGLVATRLKWFQYLHPNYIQQGHPGEHRRSFPSQSPPVGFLPLVGNGSRGHS